MNQQIPLLKVIVGSQAHGLATPESDFDYRGVFAVPTKEILSIGGVTSQTNWIEGKEDDTSWEVSKFLTMATKCNPTVLEVFRAPIKETTPFGEKIQELFPYVWNSTDVINAFVGYGINQRKKFLDDKDKRKNKYACAYLRTLYMAWELLTRNEMSVNMVDSPIYETLVRFKAGNFKNGEVIDICLDWEQRAKEAYSNNPDKKTEIKKVNDLLLNIRGAYWL